MAKKETILYEMGLRHKKAMVWYKLGILFGVLLLASSIAILVWSCINNKFKEIIFANISITSSVVFLTDIIAIYLSKQRLHKEALMAVRLKIVEDLFNIEIKQLEEKLNDDKNLPVL